MRLLLPMMSVLALGSACTGTLPDDDTNTPVRDVDVDGYPADEDCDDSDPSVYPGAQDIPYDGVDSDCGGEDDFDVDGDGWQGEGGGGTDCDDLDPNINPAQQERCNDKDDDCNGAIDDGATNNKTFYADDDGDGHGDSDDTTTACTAPDGYVSKKNDCNDSLATVHPGAAAVACDGYDNDCDGNLNEEAGGARIGTTDYADAWEALEAASSGDVIELCEGEHDTSLEITKSVTLRGTATNPDWVRLDGDGGTAVTVLAAGVTLENLRITGGNTLERGGGLYVTALNTVLRNAIVSNNKALQGGGIAVSANGALAVSNVTVEKNTATGDFNEGGGLYLAAGAKLTGTGLTVNNNTAEIGGGGYIQDGASLLIDSTSLISTNTSTASEGGGLAMETGANLTGATVEKNTGGGIWVYYNDTPAGLISGTVVQANTKSIAEGAGLHLAGPTDLQGVQVIGNKASSTGGGLWISYGSTVETEFDGVVVHKNDAPTAGGVWLGEGKLFITGGNFGEGADANKNGALVFADGTEGAMSTSTFTTCTGDGTTGTCQ